MSIFEEQQPCDFCQVIGPHVAEFAATPADVRVEVTSLDGSMVTGEIPTPGCWRACQTCTQLIEDADESGLLQRSERVILGHVSLLVSLPPARRKQLLREYRRGLQALHRQFWRGVDSEPLDDATPTEGGTHE